jgi:outer membrane biosynthesis protein TonB
MSSRSLGVAALLCSAFCGFGFFQKQRDEPNKAAKVDPAGEACFSGLQTAQDAAGKPIVLTTKQLDERATRRVMPTYPALLRQARIEAHGRIKILIGASGEVSCAVALYGHPLVVPSVLDAVKQWRFRPYEVSGKRTPVLAYFDFCFSSSGCPLMDLGSTPR